MEQVSKNKWVVEANPEWYIRRRTTKPKKVMSIHTMQEFEVPSKTWYTSYCSGTNLGRATTFEGAYDILCANKLLSEERLFKEENHAR